MNTNYTRRAAVNRQEEEHNEKMREDMRRFSSMFPVGSLVKINMLLQLPPQEMFEANDTLMRKDRHYVLINAGSYLVVTRAEVMSEPKIPLFSNDSSSVSRQAVCRVWFLHPETKHILVLNSTSLAWHADFFTLVPP